MYGLSGPWGPTAVLPRKYELRPNPPHKINKNNKDKNNNNKLSGWGL